MNYIDWKCEGIDCTFSDATTVPFVEASFIGTIKNVGAFKSRTLTEVAHEIEADMNRANINDPYMDAFIYGHDTLADKILADLRATEPKYTSTKSARMAPQITNVKFNPPATIVFWSDGTKTVVKAQDGEPFDPEKGLAMAMVKKYLGNKGNYFNEISKWVDKYVDPKDPLGVGNKIVEGFEKAMNDAGESASATSECVDKIRRIFNVPQEITFEGTISDTDAIKEILGYGPGKFAITFDAVKVEEPSTITPMDIFVQTGADLIELINNVKYNIENYGFITVEDYYDLAGYNATDDPQNEKYNVSKYGWTEVPTFGTTFDEDGFLLKAPEAKLLVREKEDK